MKKLTSALILLVVALAGTGCATSRGVIDVPEAISANPEVGRALKFTRVSDMREFELKPSTPDVPSLKNGEINDPAITSRAIARKRNSYGKALGDILLPEGQTVAALAESHLARGFRENGYRVVNEGDPDFDTAVPVEVDIEKFWGWFDPGFWSIQLHFQTLIKVYGPAGPFIDGEEFDSHIENNYQVASGQNWAATIAESFDSLNTDIAEDIAAFRATQE